MHFIWGVYVFLPIFMRVITLHSEKRKPTLPRLISFLCLIRMIHSSLHIENLLKTNNAAKIAAQEIQKTNTRGKWESGGAGLNSTACCILPIFGSSYHHLNIHWSIYFLQPPVKLTGLSMTSQRTTQLSELLSGRFDFFFLLSGCFCPCILTFGSIVVASMCSHGKKGYRGPEFKGQLWPI